MTHKHDHDGEELPQKQIGGVLRAFFEHVQEHDPEGVEAAFCMVANHTGEAPVEIDGETARPTHICNFAAGDPEIVAQLIGTMLDQLMTDMPGFTKVWTEYLLMRKAKAIFDAVGKQIAEHTEAIEERDKLNEPAVKDAASDALKKMMGMPGNDTKH